MNLPAHFWNDAFMLLDAPIDKWNLSRTCSALLAIALRNDIVRDEFEFMRINKCAVFTGLYLRRAGYPNMVSYRLYKYHMSIYPNMVLTLYGSPVEMIEEMWYDGAIPNDVLNNYWNSSMLCPLIMAHKSDLLESMAQKIEGRVTPSYFTTCIAIKADDVRIFKIFDDMRYNFFTKVLQSVTRGRCNVANYLLDQNRLRMNHNDVIDGFITKTWYIRNVILPKVCKAGHAHSLDTLRRFVS